MNAGKQINPRIVRAGEADIALISALAGTIWRACYPGIITREQIDYMLAWMYSPETLRDEMRKGIHYELMFSRTEPVGFASYGPTESLGIFKLHKLYLLPGLHGRGFGSSLLQHCEREATKLGARKMILNVNKRNANAIRAYERNGFRVTDSVVADIGGGFVMDDYVMEKDLV